jgi:NADPH-dependent 2,4-dienoyl-CoA reductase/sulfur reductase-like enzyme
VIAERGEPAAVALVAAGYWAVARSPKFHRPRGPACFRAACDGCLARVDGIPNVMTCRTPAADGMCIETQNVVGLRKTDLLRVTDWFFPEGMNHHELAAGVPGLEGVTKALARRVAGSGRLPTRTTALAEASRREVDALVVGAGPAGIAAATELARRGRAVEVVEDDLEWGGSMRALLLQEGAGAHSTAWDELTRDFARALTRDVRIRLRTTAAGIYGTDILLISEDPAACPRVSVVTARTLVLAPGAHDGAVAFEGNDVPAILSARAACRLLAAGVAPGRRPVVISTGGGTLFGRVYARARPEAVFVEGRPVSVRGGTRVAEVMIDAGDGQRRLSCDLLLIDAPLAPSYELCVQAGARVEHGDRGYLVRTGPNGEIRPGTYAVGQAVGTPLEPGALRAEARALPLS